MVMFVYVLLTVLAICCMLLSCCKEETLLVSIAKAVDSIMAGVGYAAVIYVICFYFVADWFN